MTLPLLIALDRSLPPRLIDDLESKLTYLSEHILDARVVAGPEGNHGVQFQLTGPDPDLERATRTLVEKMARSFQELPTEIAWQSDQAPDFSGDALAALEAEGQLRRTGSGLYALGPGLLALKRLLEEDLDRMARELQAEFHQFPTLIGTDTLDKCGYFASFPHHLTFASRIVRDLEVMSTIARTSVERRATLHRALVPPEHALQPNLCFHCYALLEGRTLDRNTVINCQGVCFRHEGTRFHGLDRLFEFTMRELVFIGEPEFVQERRNQLMEMTKGLVRAWGLAARLETASDPFFVNVYASKRFFQLATKAKFELLAPLPHEGQSLAIGSFNMHGDFFAKPFGIAKDEACAHTGCVGFGLERWIYAFLAQHGTAPAAWPASLRNRLQAAQ